MADARDSKSREGNFMWVRTTIFSFLFFCGILSPYGTSTPVGARPHIAYANVLPALAKNNHTRVVFLTRRPREGNFMWVRLPPPAPDKNNPNLIDTGFESK